MEQHVYPLRGRLDTLDALDQLAGLQLLDDLVHISRRNTRVLFEPLEPYSRRF